MVFVGSIVSWSLVHSVPHSVAATGETVSILQLDSRRQQEQVLKIAGGLSSAMATLSRGKPSGRKPDHKARQQRAADAYAVMSNTTAGFAQLAEDSIHGHHDQPIPEDIVLNPMLETLSTLKIGLIDEIKDLQDLVDNSNDDVTQCNTALQDHFDQPNGITDKQLAVGSARDEHRTCRENEVSADNDQTIACQGFEAARSCEHTSDWFAGLPASCSPTLEDVVAKAQDCEAKKTIFAPLPDQCDLQQEQFESGFCSYAIALEDACSDQDACYGRTVERKSTVDDEVKQLETSHKQLFTAVEKCECYIGVVQLARTKNLTKSDIETCNNKKSNTADLDVTYPVAVDKADCNTEDNKPGDDVWISTEYSAFPADNLESVTPCLTVSKPGEATPTSGGSCWNEDGFANGDWFGEGAGVCGLASTGITCVCYESQSSNCNGYWVGFDQWMELFKDEKLKFLSNQFQQGLCGIRMSDDTLVCKRLRQADGRFDPFENAPTGPMKWVGVGSKWSIAVDFDGEVHLFGSAADDFQDKPTPKVKSVFMQAYYYCATTENDEVFCHSLGWAEFGYPGDPPAELATGWLSLALSHEGYACGIRKDDSTIQCWPEDNCPRTGFECQEDTGVDLRGMKAVEIAGLDNLHYGVCAVLEDHTLQCATAYGGDKARKFLELAVKVGKVKDMKMRGGVSAVKMDGTRVGFNMNSDDLETVELPDYAGQC